MRTTPALSLLTGLVTAAAVTLSACGGSAPPRPGASPSMPSVPGAASPASGVALTAASGPAGTVTATGSGIVSGAPDTLQISIGVQTEAAHATDALAQDNARAAAVDAALRHDGVAAAD
ncbi:MAG: SIMPL domain-containing protein, partial [Actinomycetes bacterium]